MSWKDIPGFDGRYQAHKRGGYAADVKDIIPAKKISGASIFSDDVLKRLERLNRKWRTGK